VALDLHWDRTSPWIEADGRRLPARPVFEGDDEDGQRWWVAGIPFENRAALLLIVDESENGETREAIVQLLLRPPMTAGSSASKRFHARLSTGAFDRA
jgi:hypothetical protein